MLTAAQKRQLSMMVFQKGSLDYATQVAADDAFALSELAIWLPGQIINAQAELVDMQKQIDNMLAEVASKQAVIAVLQAV